MKRVAGFLAAVLLLCGCDLADRKADRLYREATERLEAGDLDQGVALLQEVLESYPDTDAAAEARKEIGLYRGVAGAVRNYPRAKAQELMIRIGRLLEPLRARRKLPSGLDALVPGSLDQAPLDPWGHRLKYVRDADRRGYTLTCFAADGVEGGKGAGRDLVIRNGEFLWSER